MTVAATSEAPEILLRHYLKKLKLPTVLREYEKLARQCASENVDHVRYLTRLIELELLDREARTVERRIRDARFPSVKSLESFDFDAIPSLNKKLVLDLARCDFVARRENVIALGPSGTGKTHAVCGIGLAACQRGVKTCFATAAAIVHEMIEAQDDKRLMRLQKTLASYELPSSGLRGRICGHGPPRHRRVGLRTAVAHRRRAAVRADQPALRARRHDHHLEPALRRMDRDLRG